MEAPCLRCSVHRFHSEVAVRSPSAVEVARRRMHGGGNSARLLAQVAALVAELTASVGELPTAAENSAPRPDGRPLSTKEAALRLGVSVYTLNEWARLGRISCEQYSVGGRRYFYEHHLAAYQQAHEQVADAVPDSYSPGHDSHRTPYPPTQAEAHASRTRNGPRGEHEHRRPLGTRRARRPAPGRARPYAPGADAWRPPKEPER